jgi:hypothetical protein
VDELASLKREIILCSSSASGGFNPAGTRLKISRSLWINCLKQKTSQLSEWLTSWQKSFFINS